VKELCSHVAWLEKGRVRQVGPAHEVLDQYERHAK
jgi:ABC-type polysaccharide/polyol phosphate transport system ATPase subunit